VSYDLFIIYDKSLKFVVNVNKTLEMRMENKLYKMLLGLWNAEKNLIEKRCFPFIYYLINKNDLLFTIWYNRIPSVSMHARLVTWHKTFMVHIWTRRSPPLWLILTSLIACSITEIACSRDSSWCILPIVERRRLVSERPSFVMHLFKRPACRKTQASRITNIILHHHYRSFAILCRVQRFFFTL